MNNALGLLVSLKSNPLKFFNAMGLNIPQNINTPEGIIQHLLNTGQVSQQQINHVMSMRNDPKIRQMFNLK